VPLSTAIIAFVPSTLGFQPEMEPSSEAKMNLAGCEVPFFVTLKNGVPLKTTPVGFPPRLLLPRYELFPWLARSPSLPAPMAVAVC